MYIKGVYIHNEKRFLYTLIYRVVYIKGFIYIDSELYMYIKGVYIQGGKNMKEQKLEEAVDFLSDIVEEADNIINLLQEIEVHLEKLIRKSRQLKEDALHARSLLTGG